MKRRPAKKAKPTARHSPSSLFAAIDRARGSSTDERIQALLHELQVHSEEITVQNEQLLKVQAELEYARDRYADLYDFAPIGYVALNHAGVVLEANLMASMLLERQRHVMINLPFQQLTAEEHRGLFRDFLLRCVRTDHGPAPHVELRLRTAHPRIVRMVARPLASRDGSGQIFTALIDVTDERRLERERQLLYEREQQRSRELADEIQIRQNAEDRVKALVARLVEVQEQERRRLALNLHDHLGQQLTALQLTLSALKADNLSTQLAQQRFDMIEQIVTQLDRDVDFLAWELRPAALDDMGLDAALDQFIRRWSTTQGIDAQFHSTALEGVRLSAEIESHLYRIVQEALNNVSKHASASQVSVLLERRDGDVTLIVEDDGGGFDPDEVRTHRGGGGMGLAGMQERAAFAGGVMHCESAPGKGTTLFIRIPMRLEDGGSPTKSPLSPR